MKTRIFYYSGLAGLLPIATSGACLREATDALHAQNEKNKKEE